MVKYPAFGLIPLWAVWFSSGGETNNTVPDAALLDIQNNWYIFGSNNELPRYYLAAG